MRFDEFRDKYSKAIAALQAFEGEPFLRLSFTDHDRLYTLPGDIVMIIRAHKVRLNMPPPVELWWRSGYASGECSDNNGYQRIALEALQPEQLRAYVVVAEEVKRWAAGLRTELPDSTAKAWWRSTPV